MARVFLVVGLSGPWMEAAARHVELALSPIWRTAGLGHVSSASTTSTERELPRSAALALTGGAQLPTGEDVAIVKMVILVTLDTATRARRANRATTARARHMSVTAARHADRNCTNRIMGKGSAKIAHPIW